jgi:phosphate transport system permease protein
MARKKNNLAIRRFKESSFKYLFIFLTGFVWLILFLIILGLFLKSRSVLATKPIGELLFSTVWKPNQGEFGLFSFIIGTFSVTGIAILIAVPVCLLTGIFLSEYAHKRFQSFFRPIIDLLAGIPSVIYGLWGILMIVPWIRNTLAPAFGVSSRGYSLLAGGIVLAIMVSPVIINITIEVLKSIPREIREVALTLGATKWQAVKTLVFRKGLSGIVAGIVLAISRAFGETMAVLMVAGNVAKIPENIFDPVYPLPALIANSYSEMMSVPLVESSLMFASLVLLLIVLIFNIVSRFILMKIEKRSA